MAYPNQEPQSPVILFDGLCTLCNEAVAWVISRDKRGVFRFASLQSDASRRLLSEAGAEVPISEPPQSMVVVDEAGVHTQSSAALRIARGLGFPWSLGQGFVIVPPPAA